MNERHRRRRREYQHSRESRHGNQQDQGAWRDDRRSRFPEEPYGGEREERTYWSGGATQFRGGARYGDRQRGYSVDDRSSYEPQRQPGRRGENYQRIEDYRWSGGGRTDQGAERGRRDRDDDRWRRDRTQGGYGSQYGSWRSGAGFGFGPEEDPRGDAEDARYAQGSMYGQGDMNTDRMGTGEYEDTDWAANRPARGRGTWAGDWSIGAGGAGEYAPQGRMSTGNWESPGRRGEYAGRGPKDYRRSDDRIREEICDALTDDPWVDASDVAIRVENGEVTLTGFVPDREQKRRAEDDAERISGVHEVINQLRVSRESSGGQGQPSQAGGGARSQRAVAADKP
jgi:osmotically-inducible protein OsmY